MANEFQSNTFRFALSEQQTLNAFKKDIETIKSINPKYLENIIEHSIKFAFADTKKKEQIIINEVIESNLLDNEEIFEAVSRVIRLFCEVFIHEKTKDENIDRVLGDLSNELKIDELELTKIKNLIEIVKIKSPQYKSLKNISQSEAGVLPYLKGFNTTVELRGMFSREFGLGDNPDSYIKEVEVEKNAIPIISVNIGFDSGNPDEIFFQATPEDLTLLINELKVAVEKAKILQKYFTLKK